jgi:hypothetical protein
VCPSSLDSKEHVLLPLWSFQGARRLSGSIRLERPPTEDPPPKSDHWAGLSKLNSVNAELDVVPGEPADRTISREIIEHAASQEAAMNRADAYRSKSSGIP